LQNLLAQLSGSEYKIASYLYDRLEKADAHGVFLTDKELSNATGVSLRLIAAVRKSLIKQSLVHVEIVRGRGTTYYFPAALAAGPGSPSPSAGVEEIMVRRDAGEMEAKESSAPPGTAATPDQQPPAVMTPKAIDRPAPAAAAPVPRPLAPRETAQERAAALIAEMMEGQEPDILFLQNLQELARGPDILLECLQWMLDKVHPGLGIKEYRFPAGEYGRGMFTRAIEHLCKSSESPFLKWRRAQKR
jgi:hypothetical protein